MLIPYKRCARKKPIYYTWANIFKKINFSKKTVKKVSIVMLPVLITNIALGTFFNVNNNNVYNASATGGGFCEMVLVKTDSPDPVKPGEEISYHLVLTSTGTGMCTGGGVELREKYDSNTTYISSVPPSSAGNLWNFGEVPPGEVNVVDIIVKVSEDAVCGSTIINEACFWTREYGTEQCITEETTIECDPPLCACDGGIKILKLKTVLPYNGGTVNVEARAAKKDKLDSDPYGVDVESFDGSPFISNTFTDAVAITSVTTQGGFATVKFIVDITQIGDNKMDANTEYRVTLDGASNETLIHTSCSQPITPPLVFGDFEILSLTDKQGAMCILEEPFCGDFIKNGTEQCDGTDGVGENQTCTDACTLEDNNFCGDGEIQNPNDSGLAEICDDADENGVICVPGYGQTCSYCSDSCKPIEINGPECGDGVINDPSEQCDGTDGVGENQSCTEQCTLISIEDCGDGVKNGDEQCDGTDGVGESQVCTEECTLTDFTFCGDGVMQTPNDAGTGGPLDDGNEECDDGNTDNDDQCDNQCIEKSIPPPPPPPPVCVGCGGGVQKKPRLLVTKTVDNPLVCPGDMVNYNVTIKNIGNKVGQNLALIDTLPNGFTYATTTATTTSTTYEQAFGDIAAGETKEVFYEVVVGDVPSGTYTNLAVATIDFTSPPGNSDQASVPVRVGICPAPVLTIEKSADHIFVNPGQELDFTIIVTNNGVEELINVVVSDVLPDGFVAKDGILTWNLGNLAPGQSETIIFTARASLGVIDGNYVNIATASADNFSDVSDDADVNVKGLVLGVEFEELPDTGTGYIMITYFIVNILALLSGFWLYNKTKRYRFYA